MLNTVIFPKTYHFFNDIRKKYYMLNPFKGYQYNFCTGCGEFKFNKLIEAAKKECLDRAILEISQDDLFLICYLFLKQNNIIDFQEYKDFEKSYKKNVRILKSSCNRLKKIIDTY